MNKFFIQGANLEQSFFMQAVNGKQSFYGGHQLGTVFLCRAPTGKGLLCGFPTGSRLFYAGRQWGAVFLMRGANWERSFLMRIANWEWYFLCRTQTVCGLFYAGSILEPTGSGLFSPMSALPSCPFPTSYKLISLGFTKSV